MKTEAHNASQLVCLSSCSLVSVSLSVCLFVTMLVSVSVSVNAFLDHKSGVPICHPRETRCRQLPTLGGMSGLPVSPSASNFPQLSSLDERKHKNFCQA